MKKSNFWFGSLFISFFILSGLFFSQTKLAAQSAVDSANVYLDKINSATSIMVEEQIVNIGKDYTIKIDGDVVGEVNGKNFKDVTTFWGEDVFTLKTKDGLTIASEEENKRVTDLIVELTFLISNTTRLEVLKKKLLKTFFRYIMFFTFSISMKMKLVNLKN